MPNITDFMSGVYDMLSKQIGSMAAGSYLQMGWPGISLSPADFKASNNPAAPYDGGIAEETVSMLGNIEPACSPLKFDNSGFEVDDLYQILISGAIPQGADPNNLAGAPAYKLFSDAQYEFLNAQKGSPRDPNRFYYPCRATPADWYTETGAQKWPTLSLTSSQVKPATGSSPFVKLGGQQLVNAGVLRVAPADSKTLIKSRFQAGVEQRVSRYEARVPASMYVNVKPLEAAKIQMANVARAGPPIGTMIGSVDRIDVNAIRIGTAAQFLPAAKVQLRPTFAVRKFNAQNLPEIDTARFDLAASQNIPFGERLYLRHVLSEQLIPKPVTTTEGFSISFRFCLVTLDRSWLKLALLNTRNWYMTGVKGGEYSQGKIDNNPGMFPMISTALVAIRDLKITANWSSQDAQTLAQSKAFGPFDVRSGTFNQSTLEAPQLQVIGWVSRLTPSLPPMKDPALPA